MKLALLSACLSEWSTGATHLYESGSNETQTLNLGSSETRTNLIGLIWFKFGIRHESSRTLNANMHDFRVGYITSLDPLHTLKHFFFAANQTW